MAEEKRKGAADVFIRITEALESGFVKFCETVKELIKFFFIFLMVAGPIALIVGGTIIHNSNDAFEPTQSRLAQQINEVIGSNNGMDSAQEEAIVRLLIENYDPINDDLNPVINPNVKPVDLKTILTHFNVDESGVKLLSNPNSSSGDKSW
jgi:hypothetical protein